MLGNKKPPPFVELSFNGGKSLVRLASVNSVISRQSKLTIGLCDGQIVTVEDPLPTLYLELKQALENNQ